MNTKSILTLVFIFNILNLKADPGYFDLFSLKYEGEIYFYTTNYSGVLKPDLCYYNHNDKFINTAYLALDDNFNRIDSVVLYKKLDKIGISKLNNLKFDGDGHVYNFRNPIKFSSKDIIGSYEIVEAKNVHSSAQIDPICRLRERDQFRIDNNKFNLLFSVPGIEAWEYHFYAIENQFDDHTIFKIKEQLINSLKERSNFDLTLLDIFEEGIIILCDCYE
ncbi:MAG TPA: hypothetical protein PKD51_06435 [Saprospiraceae bacterium]|mgnify:CR=1 FL=1|nr:hypothetical protein [Saprospiraceae bacterium]